MGYRVGERYYDFIVARDRFLAVLFMFCLGSVFILFGFRICFILNMLV